MLRSTFYSFTTALQGLNTAQKQLDVTGQNISNVSTYGYTRQRADTYSALPAGYGDKYATRKSNMVGQGVIVGSISQCRDQFLDVRFRREAANLGEESEKLGTMEDLSLIFDEIESSGLMSGFKNFVEALNELAGNAESAEFDSIARDAAKSLVTQFNEYANQLANIREENEYNLKEVTVNSINDLVSNIAALNKSIREVQAAGNPALELKDERNLLIDELSNFMKLDVKYTPKDVGGGIIVDDVSISMVGADGKSRELIYNEAYSEFSVKTNGSDNTKDAIVTIDTSALESKKTLDTLNNLIKSMASSNMALNDVNKKLAEMYPATAPDVPPTYEDLVDTVDASGTVTKKGLLTLQKEKLDQLELDIAAADTTLETAKTAQKDAEDALKTGLAQDPPLDEAAITALRDAVQAAKDDVKAATAARTTLFTDKSDAQKEQKKLNDFKKEMDRHVSNVSYCDNRIQAVMTDYGITATLTGDPGDTTSHYTFADANGAINGADGNPLTWKTGSSYTKLDRETFEKLGVTFLDEDTTLDASEINSPGALKGALDMLNSSGTFDYEANQIRGIGYYESMLDTLANQLANTLNKLNDLETTGAKEHLFETSDGSFEFTAANIKISDDWLNGKYSITNSKNPAAGDAQADNILLMISTISTKLNYSTGAVPNQDADGNYLKTNPDGTTAIAANGRDKDGNYIMKSLDANGNEVTTLVANKDFVNYKTVGSLTRINADSFSDDSGRVYSRTAGSTDDIYTYTDPVSGNSTSVNSTGVMYKGNGSTGEYQLDANTVELTLDTTAGSPTEGKYIDATGTEWADAIDADGNYIKTDADGKTTLVANSDGVLYKTDPATGAVVKDSNGNPVLDAAESKLDNRPESFLYNGTFQEYLSNISNVLSLDISSTSNLVANHETVLNDIQTSKDSVSSVSLDEEGVNILQYQKAYNAAARLMTALDEAIERIINQMGTVGR